MNMLEAQNTLVSILNPTVLTCGVGLGVGTASRDAQTSSPRPCTSVKKLRKSPFYPIDA